MRAGSLCEAPVVFLSALVLKTLRSTLTTALKRQATPRDLYSLSKWENGAFQRRDLTFSRSPIEAAEPCPRTRVPRLLAEDPDCKERRLGGGRASKINSVTVGSQLNSLTKMRKLSIRESKRPAKGHTAGWDFSDLESGVPNTTLHLPERRTWRLEEVEVGIRGPWRVQRVDLGRAERDQK